MPTEKSDVQEWIEECLQDLVEISRDPSRAGQIAKRIRILLAADPTPPAGGRFTRYTQAKFAVLDVLEEAGRALTMDEIVAAVIDGGFKAGKEDANLDVKKCLGVYRDRARGKRKQTLRWVGDKIGRGEWADERFK